MEWQPIETAPKDGTRVILIGGKWANPITSAIWHGNMWTGGAYNNSSVNGATHWMPFIIPTENTN